MRLYFDAAYVAKCYLNEPDGTKVRRLATGASGLYSSALCIAELACIFLRQIREGSVNPAEASKMRTLFMDDIRNGVWILLPVSQGMLVRVESLVAALPARVYLRTGDAIHLASAREAGFEEIWTNDRHLLAAAPYFGLAARSV